MDNTKYWLKLEKNFLKSKYIKIIKDMPNGHNYILFYLALMLESIDSVGHLRFTDLVPYNEQMLSSLTDMNIDIVRSAMKLFRELGMITILEDGTIFMPEVPKLTGKECDSAERVRLFRNKRKLLQSNDTVTNSNADEIKSNDNIEKRREEKSERESAAPNSAPQSQQKDKLGTHQNVMLSQSEYNDLSMRYGTENTRTYVNRLSSHMQSNSKTYADHHATLMRWISDDIASGKASVPRKEILMPKTCDTCGKPLDGNTCHTCNRRVFGENGVYRFEDIPDQAEIQSFQTRMRSIV